MAETEREAIVDGQDSSKVASIVVNTTDPTKCGIVALNADGTKIGS